MLFTLHDVIRSVGEELPAYIVAVLAASFVIWQARRLRIGGLFRRLNAQPRWERREGVRVSPPKALDYFDDGQLALLGKWRQRFGRRPHA